MLTQGDAQRNAVKEILSSLVSDQQSHTARRAYQSLSQGTKACVVFAESHSGSCNIAIALAGLYRLQLNDVDISNQSHLKNTIYLATSDNLAFRERAKTMISSCNYINFCDRENFKSVCNSNRNPPTQLFIVDESHHRHACESMCYEELFQYISRENMQCKLVIISSTPFTALTSNSLNEFTNDKNLVKFYLSRGWSVVSGYP